jgi:hypothetical protein
MVRMRVIQSGRSGDLLIQINSGDPHFVRLNEVLASLPFRGLPELERFVDLHDPGEEIEDGWGSDESVSLITDEADGGEDRPCPLSSQDEDGGGNGVDLSEGDSDDDRLPSGIYDP